MLEVDTKRCELTAKGMRLGIVVSRWNELVTKQLLEGALDEFERLGGQNAEVVWVPGTWEAPVVAKALLERKSSSVDCAVVLGCIMQGQTPHAGLLGSDVSGALMSLQISTGKPIGWGVLTPENLDQALDRAGVKHGNKGREAVQAAVEAAACVRALKG